MGDETAKIFLNSKGSREGINHELAAFLDYIEGKSPQGKFTESIADAVEAAKRAGMTEKAFRKLVTR